MQHLLDSADVAPLVWNWLPTNVRQGIQKELPATARDGQMLLRWLAGSHDIGKCSPPFAAKVPALADKMREYGMRPPRDTTEFSKAPHGLVGHAILARWLRARYAADPRSARTYAVVVGGHHGVPPTSGKLQWLAARDHLIGDAAWQKVQDEILDQMAAYTGADVYLPVWATHQLSPTVQSLLTGAVIVCDWLASNIELFPFDTSTGKDRATLAWRELDLPQPWRPVDIPEDVTAHLARRFPGVRGTPRAVQRLALEAARDCAGAPLIILESTMGSGKTEAALMAAEVLAQRFDCGGLFFGLPTMATADALFRRVLDWISHLDGDGVASTYLAHGKAGLNDDYRGLFRSPSRVSGIYDDDAQSARVEALAQAWLTGRKKGVLASMVVGTVDQLLFMALQSKHVVLRQLGLAGKVVVVDEVHAADDYMRMYLCRALEWLAAYGVPVILLSATLPSAQRQELANAYRAGLDLPFVALNGTAAYPLVTTVSSAVVTTAADDSPPEQTVVSVRTIDDDLEALTAVLDDWLVDGGCVAVIRNTVRRAQETAQALRVRYGDDVVLHHSRFIATHRAQREATLRDELGPDGRRPHRRIVVGTQVLEQSLDVDFDALVIDLAPVDLVLQRVGRLHRHPRRRPSTMASAQVVIAGVREWTESGPRFDPGSQRVYGQSRLLRAAGVLGLIDKGTSQLNLPNEIRPLVEAAYGSDPPVPTAWREVARKADKKHARNLAEARDRADAFRIRSIPELEGDLVNLLEDSAKEADDDRGAARVRDSEDGIEVIVVQRVDGAVRFIDDGSQYSGQMIPTLNGGIPDDDVARALAAVTVRLPLAMTSPSTFAGTLDALEADGHEGWQHSRWLAGQLVIHLDADWRTTVGGFDLSYTQDAGLMFTQEEAA